MPRHRNPELISTVGKRIADARKQAGFTQERLAEALGLEPVSLSRIETGDRSPSLSTLALIAVELHVPLSGLVDVNQELPTSEHAPEMNEMIRLFKGLSNSQQDALLRMARELASTSSPQG